MTRARRRPGLVDPVASLPPALAGGMWSWLLAGGICDLCRARVLRDGPHGVYPHCHRRFGALLEDHLDRIGWQGSLRERTDLLYRMAGPVYAPPPDLAERLEARR